MRVNEQSCAFKEENRDLKVRKRQMPLAKSQWHLYRWDIMVEVGGVEPPSENPSTSLSPSADGYLHSLGLTATVSLQPLVAS